MITQLFTYNYLYRDSVQALENFYFSKIVENRDKLREMEEKKAADNRQPFK